jgi:hypothetical protein
MTSTSPSASDNSWFRPCGLPLGLAKGFGGSGNGRPTARRLKQPSNFPPFRQGIIRKEIIWRAKGQLAFDILTEAFADSIRPDFVCGDEIYGLRTELREYPKNQDAST